MTSDTPDHARLRRAWLTLYRLNALFQSRLEEALRSRAGMSLAEHELLAVLHGAGGRLRMGDLTARLLLSKSGVTRLVAKIEEGPGWVVRVLTPEDRRATWAELTPSGEEAFQRSDPVFRETLVVLFGDHLRPAELDRVVAGMEHLVNANEWMTFPPPRR
ncbi:MAG TPA: MarR family transcriptional regulator [Thermomonospora sp.]|nr:MarR family transcriptional regulator [Thermomonospora sp.]